MKTPPVKHRPLLSTPLTGVLLMLMGMYMLLLVPLKSSAQEVRQRLGASDHGSVSFMSANRRTTFGQVYQKTVAFDETISADLRFPRQPPPGRLPAVVIMHSSAGVSAAEEDWSNFFNEMGLATLVVDSFTPRHIQRSVEDQNVLNVAASAMDALKALELLATHPAIDPARIAVIGFSRGGGAGLHASFERVRQAAIADDTRFAIHLLFYPSCSEFARTTGAPLHLFMGSEDAYNSVEKCRFNVEQLQRLGAKVELTVYDGAKHGFDTAMPGNVWVPLGTSALDCPIGSMNLDTGKALMQDGRTLPAPDFIKLRTGCIRRGFAVGGHPRYREQSREAVKKLLQGQFGL
ncbi:dienelactone hydrolase family protein [Herbaspirillum rubrisubalbicans]|uniref:dienelactone hydrolase family protein n=1 Tax=Herbaspirillum rubrisubalbicans TaxID=80842 RepID=UPI001558F761|nr:dienelactone hydrolase family protein [Herbaspirillum rubrisubalbicans]NQE47572.1 hypothetical protein [Herbaspirillum rubrisubalbicans]